MWTISRTLLSIYRYSSLGKAIQYSKLWKQRSYNEYTYDSVFGGGYGGIKGRSLTLVAVLPYPVETSELSVI